MDFLSWNFICALHRDYILRISQILTGSHPVLRWCWAQNSQELSVAHSEERGAKIQGSQLKLHPEVAESVTIIDCSTSRRGCKDNGHRSFGNSGQ